MCGFEIFEWGLLVYFEYVFGCFFVVWCCWGVNDDVCVCVMVLVMCCVGVWCVWGCWGDGVWYGVMESWCVRRRGVVFLLYWYWEDVDCESCVIFMVYIVLFELMCGFVILMLVLMNFLGAGRFKSAYVVDVRRKNKFGVFIECMCGKCLCMIVLILFEVFWMSFMFLGLRFVEFVVKSWRVARW